MISVLCLDFGTERRRADQNNSQMRSFRAVLQHILYATSSPDLGFWPSGNGRVLCSLLKACRRGAQGLEFARMQPMDSLPEQQSYKFAYEQRCGPRGIALKACRDDDTGQD